MNDFRKRYHQELDELCTLTSSLGNLVDKALSQSIAALGDSNAASAKEVIRADRDVDDLSLRIEELCMKLLALQQPMAKDLRYIVGMLKISIDLERIGDLAMDIAKVRVKLKNPAQDVKLKNIIRMSEISYNMLYQALDSLANRDSNAARQTTRWDFEIDNLYIETRDQLIITMVNEPELINKVSSLLLLNRHLERIGDNVCNICESIVYILEAKREHLN